MSSNILIFDKNHDNIANIKVLCNFPDCNIISSESLDQFQEISDKNFISVILINDQQKKLETFVNTLKKNIKFNLIPIMIYGQRILDLERYKLIASGVLDVLDFPINPSIFKARLQSAIVHGQIFEQFSYHKETLDRDKHNMFFNERLKISKELAMNLANEIKDHFNFILNSTNILIKKSLEESLANEIKKINQYAASACNILNFMVEQTSLQAPVFKKMSIYNVVDKAISKIHQELAKNSYCPIKIFSNIYDANFNIDQINLEKSIYNILVNAYESIFMHNDITFYGIIEVNGFEKNGTYIISIKDNGIGIHSDTTKKIFNPFFSTKSNKPGMGLTFARQVIENSHKGSIKVESENSKGCVFEITLPLNN